MGAPLPALSRYVLIRSTVRMWVTALVANLVAATITYGWLGRQLAAISADVPPFDRMRWASAGQITEHVTRYTPAMKAAYLPFSLADGIFAIMGAVSLALTMGVLMRAAPSRFMETLALGHVFWLPVGTAAFDWGENAGLLYLLHSAANDHAWAAEATSLCKSAKTVALWSTCLLTGVLALLALARKLQKRP